MILLLLILLLLYATCVYLHVFKYNNNTTDILEKDRFLEPISGLSGV